VRRLVLILSLLTWTGCYRFAVTSRGGDAEPGTEKSDTKWSFLWGLLEEEPTDVNAGAQPSCLANATPSEVTATTHLGFFTLQLVTLGAVAGATLSWKCAQPDGVMPTPP